MARLLAPPGRGAAQEVRLLAVADLGASEPDGWSELGAYPASRLTTQRMAADVAGGGYQLLVCVGGRDGLGGSNMGRQK